MRLKFLDLYYQKKTLEKKIINSFQKNLKNSSFIGGKGVKKFEDNFAKFLKIKYCLGVANGTDALEIAIKVLKLKKNSEILVQANTWISSAQSALSNNFKLKFLDCDETHNICLTDLKKKLSNKVSAIIVTHLYGNPSNIIKIKKLCKKYKTKIIEDCAQAHGAIINKKKVSTFGDISTFSFFPSKNLGGIGDGGAIVTNNKKYYINAKKISNQGGLKKFQNDIIGRNSRLDNINAEILNIKLIKLKSWIINRNKQANLYKKNLSNVGDITFIKELNNTLSSRYVFIIKTKLRNSLRKFLEKKGIQTHCHYPRTLPELPVFKKKYFNDGRKMKIFEENKKILSLPLGEHLKNVHINYISKSIKEFYD